jgi:N-dimethylarginine dimethylaminohydrolase
MCAPDWFDVHFLFNPHMDYSQRVDRRRAKTQWQRLVRVLEDAGAELEFLEPRRGFGPLVFTADGALCYRPGDVLVLRNDGVRGEVEPRIFRDWFGERGFRVESVPPHLRLDGGNLVRLPGGDVLAGLKPGASGAAERYLSRLLRFTCGANVLPVPLVDERFQHHDTAVGVLGPSRFLVYEAGLRQGVLDSAPFADAELVHVSAEDAARFACNVVVVGDVVVTGPVSDGLARRIGGLGYHVERVDLSEFYKAGGGAKCLTLPLVPPQHEGGQGDERAVEPRRRAVAAR